MAIWKITPGEYGQYRNFFLKNKLIAMGWSDVGHLSWFSTKKKLALKCEEVGYAIGSPRTSDVQLWDFKKIEINDMVISYGDKSILGIGIVTSDYFYENSKSKSIDPTNERIFAHRYNVIWINNNEIDISSNPKLFKNKKGCLLYTSTINKIIDKETIEEIKKIVINSLF